MNKKLLAKLKKIKLLVLDFDGVLTDNKVIVSEDGKELVVCDRSDSLGIDMLKKIMSVIVISKETNNVVKKRCDKLKIKCYDATDDKISKLANVAKEMGVEMENVCYIGNDINDLACLKKVGFGVAVANSYPTILSAADYVTKNKGGDGAVREVCDILLEVHNYKIIS
ncbi:MAG: HAD hydrolase family protein [Candidatus Falkowbacteria bacterium]